MAKKTGGVYGSASSSVNNLHKDNVQRFHSSKASYHGKLSEAQQVRLLALLLSQLTIAEQLTSALMSMTITVSGMLEPQDTQSSPGSGADQLACGCSTSTSTA